MGLRSKITNSKIGKAMLTAMGGAAFIPTIDMLNPPAVYAEHTPDYSGLLKRIKTSPDTIPVRFRKPDGSVENLRAHRLTGYNPNLQSTVDFTWYPVQGGILETRIGRSDYLPESILSEELSYTFSLIVNEGGGSPIDGKPESVGVQVVKQMRLGPTRQSPLEITTSTHPLEEYRTDQAKRQGIDGDYHTALTTTVFR